MTQRSDSPLRIVIATADASSLEIISKTVSQLGYQVSSTFKTGSELIKSTAVARPDLLICDCELQDRDASLNILGSMVSIILVTERPASVPLGNLTDNQIWSCLIKPLRSADLQAAIAVAVARRRQFVSLQHQVTALRRALFETSQSTV